MCKVWVTVDITCPQLWQNIYTELSIGVNYHTIQNHTKWLVDIYGSQIGYSEVPEKK